MRASWSSWLLVAMVGTWACGGSNTPSGGAGTPPADSVTPVPSSTSAPDPVSPVAPPVAPPSGDAATAVLYGRVIGSDQPGGAPQGWQVRVTAEYEDGSDVPPRDRDSTGDLFAFKVVPGKRVRLYFEAVPYQATITEFVDVNDERRYASRMPDVVMDRIRWTMALFANGNGEAFARNLEGASRGSREDRLSRHLPRQSRVHAQGVGKIPRLHAQARGVRTHGAGGGAVAAGRGARRARWPC